MNKEEFDSIFDNLNADDSRYGSEEVGYKLIKKLWKQYRECKKRITELESTKQCELECVNARSE